MNLTQDSQKKQVIGIILVVVFLLVIFVYGTKGCRDCPSKCQNTCQTEDSSPIDAKVMNLSQ
ncbi:MAG TPA: hypothetical protein VHK67_00955 [Rhabdochlamydiaceae bacterium]|nr:hypothetical protein [Rhabdochlamydiaceae bacterium]